MIYLNKLQYKDYDKKKKYEISKSWIMRTKIRNSEFPPQPNMHIHVAVTI